MRLLSLFVPRTKEDKNNLVISAALPIFAAHYKITQMEEQSNLEQIMQRLDKRLDEIKRLTLLQTKKALTVEDVANLTGYSKAYVYKLTSEGRLPYYKPNGKAIYFDRDEIERYMLSNRVDAVADSAQMAAAYCSRTRE